MVSIIIPTYNEEQFIDSVLKNLLEQDYPQKYLEILVIDGNSTDKTAEIVKSYTDKYNFIDLIINPERIVPISLNMGITMAKGEIIIRIDAHAIYPADYISKLVMYLELLNADNVGGVIETVPADHKIKSLAISCAISSSFGVGNSYFRIGTNKIKEVDTVPFGCYRREIFDKVGYFDEELIRNQDDEFNARLKKNSGKIYLIPEIKIIYYSRDKFSKLYNMFFQYGLFKPLVNKKIGKATSYRQFAPAGFVLLLLIIPFLFSINRFLFYGSLLFVITYILMNLLFSIKIAIDKKNFKLLSYLPMTFLLVHLAYGIGYLFGIIRFRLLNKSVRIEKVILTR